MALPVRNAMNGPRPVPTRRIVETAAGAALILFRLLHVAPEQLWRDALLILGAYWMFCIWGRRTRLWPVLTMVTMGVLLAIYLHGQALPTIYTYLPPPSGPP